MEPSTTEQRDFIPYPTNRIVGTVADAQTARAAIDALLEPSFAREDIDTLHGEEDAERLDHTLRTAVPVEEHKHLMHHIENVRAGRFVVMVLAKERSKREVAAGTLNAHGDEFIGFYVSSLLNDVPSRGMGR